MIVSIERKAKAGFPPALTIQVDGEVCGENRILSRKLTSTDNEFGEGIFSAGEVCFYRSSLKVYLRFKELDWNAPLTVLCREIHSRIQAVNEAFEKIQPEFYESISFDID